MKRILEWLLRRNNSVITLFRDNGKLKPETRAFLVHLRDFCHRDRPAGAINPKTGSVDTHSLLVIEGRREMLFEIEKLIEQSAYENEQIREELRILEKEISDAESTKRFNESFIPMGD